LIDHEPEREREQTRAEARATARAYKSIWSQLEDCENKGSTPTSLCTRCVKSTAHRSAPSSASTRPAVPCATPILGSPRSSTPILGLASALGWGICWPLRPRMSRRSKDTNHLQGAALPGPARKNKFDRSSRRCLSRWNGSASCFAQLLLSNYCASSSLPAELSRPTALTL